MLLFLPTMALLYVLHHPRDAFHPPALCARVYCQQEPIADSKSNIPEKSNDILLIK